VKKGSQVTEEEILELCKKELSSYKKPRRIVFVDSLPMNESGKILKFKLREQYSRD
jgi:fatty-acyl-CoA synthase